MAQILHRGGLLCYAVDEGYGFRFQLAQLQGLEPGDNVEVVGLVSVGGASPMMCEVVARKISHAPLPIASPLVLEGTNAAGDASRVWIEGMLVGAKELGKKRIFEIQAGSRTFLARAPSDDQPVNTWPVGSRLKFTGTYSSLSPQLQNPSALNQFEILLNSSADIQLIARPPFWTFSRLLIMVLLLLVALFFIFIWVYQLRRQVERRTLQLEQEISRKERAEKERTLEMERSRIARDLHDDLGSALTAINMMATVVPEQNHLSPIGADRLHAIAKRAHSMITALDRLVWTVDPGNDTLTALIKYIASHTEEFLAEVGIPCFCVIVALRLFLQFATGLKPWACQPSPTGKTIMATLHRKSRKTESI